jgi:ABC-type protease/lipase transport system fused ATPase/permease subunit
LVPTASRIAVLVNPTDQARSNVRDLKAAARAVGLQIHVFSASTTDEKPAATSLPVPNGRLEVENAIVWPPASNRPSVKGVSFSLNPGERLAIVGASACGKSSLARALAGVWPLREGAIQIDGAAYTQWDPNRLGKHIGYLPQDPAPSPRTSPASARSTTRP